MRAAIRTAMRVAMRAAMWATTWAAMRTATWAKHLRTPQPRRGIPALAIALVLTAAGAPTPAAGSWPVYDPVNFHLQLLRRLQELKDYRAELIRYRKLLDGLGRGDLEALLAGPQQGDREREKTQLPGVSVLGEPLILERAQRALAHHPRILPDSGHLTDATRAARRIEERRNVWTGLEVADTAIAKRRQLITRLARSAAAGGDSQLAGIQLLGQQQAIALVQQEALIERLIAIERQLLTTAGSSDRGLLESLEDQARRAGPQVRKGP